MEQSAICHDNIVINENAYHKLAGTVTWEKYILYIPEKCYVIHVNSTLVNEKH